MAKRILKDPDDESVQLAMSLAWKDHHHARDQTWRALGIVAVLGGGLVAVDISSSNLIATTGAGILVILGAIFGLWITKNHRDLERRKFIHIMNCEEMLGLHRDDLIPLEDDHPEKDDDPKDQLDQMIRDGMVAVPGKFSFWRVFNFKKHNTSLFIMRLHFALILFSVIFVLARAYG